MCNLRQFLKNLLWAKRERALAMKIWRIKVTKDMLAKMSQEDSVFFILLGTMLNEINMLNKVIASLSPKAGVSDVEHKADLAQLLFFQALLAGKLWECWLGLKSSFFGAQVSKKYESQLSTDGRESLDYLKEYFGRNSWMSNVRNWFSFHYDREQIINQLHKMPEDEPLEMFLSEAQGNCLYFGSFMLYIGGITAAIDEKDAKGGLNTYLSETLKVSEKAIIFLNEMVKAIAEEYLDLRPEELEIPEPLRIGEIHLPFFVNPKLTGFGK
jgi:hypothetical protein